MALTLEPWNPSDPLVVGQYYEVHYHLGMDPGSALRSAVEYAIRNAPDFAGPIAIKNIEWVPVVTGGKADGLDLNVNFQALPHPLITESGFDLRTFIVIASAVILAVCAFNGTLKGVFHTVDDSVKASGSAALAASKLFDPLVLIGIAIVIMVAAPILKGGK